MQLHSFIYAFNMVVDFALACYIQKHISKYVPKQITTSKVLLGKYALSLSRVEGKSPLIFIISVHYILTCYFNKLFIFPCDKQIENQHLNKAISLFTSLVINLFQTSYIIDTTLCITIGY